MQKFETTAPITTVLDIPAGRVQLIAADRADVTVDVRPVDTTKSRDVKAAAEVQVGFADGVLRIDAPAAKKQYFGPSGSLEITVQLPAGSRAEVAASCSEFRAVGRLGDVVVDGAYGPVKIDEAASMRLTATGDVTVGRLTGSATISTQKGDITVSEATSGSVQLTTQQGDITVTAARGVSASLDAGTTQGRIDNALANTGTPGLTVRATTSQGDITARSL
ncbi:DUF4097 family beta strand repeat-containing protein [Streptomyces sp. Q6]|uniref:DUF4097 family beta strand repeat-containing protein n=1 Tax=Streptomyces citrinus TaxID=3118173 RepID=A0ACD5ACV4_9ACTN